MISLINDNSKTRVEMHLKSTYLTDVLEDIKLFLIASGYHFEGELEIVKKEEIEEYLNIDDLDFDVHSKK